MKSRGRKQISTFAFVATAVTLLGNNSRSSERTADQPVRRENRYRASGSACQELGCASRENPVRRFDRLVVHLRQCRSLRSGKKVDEGGR